MNTDDTQKVTDTTESPFAVLQDEAVEEETQTVAQKAADDAEVAESNAEIAEETEVESKEAKTDSKTVAEETEEESKETVEASDDEESDEEEEVAPLTPVIPDMPGHWYVVHTYAGHENKVMTTLKQRVETMKLQHKIFEVIVPTRSVVTVRHGKKEEVKEKIFPGYILVRMIMADDSWLAVRTTQGVTAFVGAGSKPTPISDKEVGAILKFMKMDAPKYKTKFSVNEAVKITDGPFADFLGTIQEIDEDKGQVKVLVSIFGRETPVALDFLQVKKL